MFLSLIKSESPFFVAVFLLVVLANPRSQTCMPMFLSENYTMLALRLGLKIYFVLTSVCSVRWMIQFRSFDCGYPVCMDIQFNHLLKRLNLSPLSCLNSLSKMN